MFFDMSQRTCSHRDTSRLKQNLTPLDSPLLLLLVPGSRYSDTNIKERYRNTSFFARYSGNHRFSKVNLRRSWQKVVIFGDGSRYTDGGGVETEWNGVRPDEKSLSWEVRNQETEMFHNKTFYTINLAFYSIGNNIHSVEHRRCQMAFHIDRMFKP